MSKKEQQKELYKTRVNAFRYLAVIGSILFHAGIVTQDAFLILVPGILLLVILFGEMFTYDILIDLIKGKRKR